MASSRARRSSPRPTTAATCSQLSREKFNSNKSDPLDPWVKGAAALYTREFWELCKSRLNRRRRYDGVRAAVRDDRGRRQKQNHWTFFSAFPHGALFVNTVNGRGYDAVLVGRANDAPIDVDLIEQRLDEPGYERVAPSLREDLLETALDLLGDPCGRGNRHVRLARQGRAQHRSCSGSNTSRPTASTVQRADDLYRQDHHVRRALSRSTTFVGSPNGTMEGLRQGSPCAETTDRKIPPRGISHRNRAGTLPRKRALSIEGDSARQRLGQTRGSLPGGQRGRRLSGSELHFPPFASRLNIVWRIAR